MYVCVHVNSYSFHNGSCQLVYITSVDSINESSQVVSGFKSLMLMRRLVQRFAEHCVCVCVFV